MVEDLQNLLDKIHRDGAERAQADADRIVAEAKSKAKEIVAAAEAQAADNLTASERDARVFVERGTATLEQAARDYILRVERGVGAIFDSLVQEAVAEALTPAVMSEMVIKVAGAYAACSAEEAHLSVLIPQADADRFVDLALGSLRSRLNAGLDVHIDDSLRKGFRVAFQDDRVYHDFTAEAIAETLAESLRPRLREIVRNAVKQATA